MSSILVCPKCGRKLFFAQIEPSEVSYLIDIDSKGEVNLEFDESTLIDDSPTEGYDQCVCCKCGFTEKGTPEEFIEKHPDLVIEV